MIEANNQMEVVSYDAASYFDSYIAKTYYKTASMISLGCRGMAIIMDLNQTEAHR